MLTTSHHTGLPRTDIACAKPVSTVALEATADAMVNQLRNILVARVSRSPDVDFGFNVGLEGSPEDFSVSIGTGT